MNHIIKLELTSGETLELIAFISTMLDELRPGAPIEFLRGVETKLKGQLVNQCSGDQLDQAIHEVNIQTLLNKAP